MQAAQLAHAAFEYSVCFPDETKRWFEDSNYLICLSTPDLESLESLLLRLGSLQHCIEIREPDIDDELTCIACGPEYDARRLLSALPLALREVVH